MNLLVVNKVDTTQWYLRGSTVLVSADENGILGRHISALTYRHIYSGREITELLDYAPGKTALKFGEKVMVFDTPQAAYQHVLALNALEA